MTTDTPRNQLQRRLQCVHRLSYFLARHRFRGSGRLREFLAHALLPVPRGPVVVPTVYGFALCVDPLHDHIIERSLYYHGTYEAGTLHVLGHCLQPGDVFLDIGSHIGLMALCAAQLVGPHGAVYAFEPLPASFAQLQANVRRNQCAQIHACQVALGAQAGQGWIAVLAGLTGGEAQLRLAQPGESRGQPVRVRTLDEMIVSEQMPAVQMLKLDVEGWELEALTGARQLLQGDHAPMLCVEYSNLHPLPQGALIDLYHYLRTVNHYEIYKLARGKEEIAPLVAVRDARELPRHDNLFCFLPAQRQRLPRHLVMDAGGR